MDCDLLVIGAGPAGSAAARHAARQGLSVTLVDRAEFPRDKVCGDALIPDAVRALKALDLTARVLSQASLSNGVQVYAPDGSPMPLRGESACLPRQILDETLRQAAVESGVVFTAALKAMTPTTDSGSISGATFQHMGTGQQHTIRARLTLLATGAASDVLTRFGVCDRTAPSATAARVYVTVPPAIAPTITDLLLSFDASICPGYGWLFPGPRATFNLGLGYFYDAWRLPAERNVRVLFDRFLRTFPPAVELMRHATSVSPLRGAPLRTAMRGVRFARPGLLVIGEAAGLTYSLTGEGIGKAMESGILAADLAASHLGRADVSLRRLAREYEGELESRFAKKFRAYRRAQVLSSSPRVLNGFLRRANASRFVREQLEAMFADTTTPHALLSPLGIWRTLSRA